MWDKGLPYQGLGKLYVVVGSDKYTFWYLEGAFQGHSHFSKCLLFFAVLLTGREAWVLNSASLYWAPTVGQEGLCTVDFPMPSRNNIHQIWKENCLNHTIYTQSQTLSLKPGHVIHRLVCRSQNNHLMELHFLISLIQLMRRVCCDAKKGPAANCDDHSMVRNLRSDHCATAVGASETPSISQVLSHLQMEWLALFKCKFIVLSHWKQNSDQFNM